MQFPVPPLRLRVWCRTCGAGVYRLGDWILSAISIEQLVANPSEAMEITVPCGCPVCDGSHLNAAVWAWSPAEAERARSTCETSSLDSVFPPPPTRRAPAMTSMPPNAA